MSKKIIAAVLCAVVIVGGIIGAVAGGKAYSANKASHPQFTETDVAENATFTKKDAEASDKKGFKKVTLDKGEYVDVDFGKNVTFNSVVLKEKGDNVTLFRLYEFKNNKWKKIYEQDRILSYRMCTFEPVIGSKLRLEIVDCKEPVTITDFEAYRLEASKEPVKVSQYLTFGAQDEIIRKRDTHDKGFSDYYNVVTDVIVYGEVAAEKNGDIRFINTEKTFGYNLMALRSIIGERKVNIWLSVEFDSDEKAMKENEDKIVDGIHSIVEKYGLYGVDVNCSRVYKSQKLYGKLAAEIAKQDKMSVTVPTEYIDLPKSAVKAAEFVNVVMNDEADERGDCANIETSTVNAVKALNKAGVDNNKILLGINAYGKFKDETTSYHGNEMKLGKFGKIVKTEGKPDLYIQSYAGARDITKYAQKTGCAGVAIFDAAGDSSYLYPYSLHRAVNEAITGKAFK